VTDDSNEVARAYDRWASTYDDDANATRDLDAEVLRASGLPLDGHTVLEIGAGTGKNTEWIAAQATTVVAIDVSDAMLARAKRRVRRRNVRFVRCDLREPWPVADASIDVVIGNLVLEHIRDVDHVFAESARVLHANGVAYFAELHPARQERGSQAQFTDEGSGDRVLVPAFVHSLGEFESAAARAGFDAVEWGDHLEHAAPSDALPRLLTMSLRRVGRSSS
jgi:ubiquinone/menaquinone biosynthesis C-methylase UbiE